MVNYFKEMPGIWLELLKQATINVEEWSVHGMYLIQVFPEWTSVAVQWY